MEIIEERRSTSLADIASSLNGLSPYLQYVAGDPAGLPYDVDWIDEAEFSRPDCPSQQHLLGQLAKSEFGANPKACSAALLLRYGWAAGFLIGAWMTRGIVITGARQRLGFDRSTVVLTGVCIEGCDDVVTPSACSVDARRRRLIEELTRHGRAVVEAHHRWSGYSRKALWSMITSSWAAQVATFAEKLGDAETALSETAELLSLDPDAAAAQPDLYIMQAGGRHGVCQRRKLCCLWYKSPEGQFCISCPILPDQERLTRTHDWIAQYGTSDTHRTLN